MNIDIKNVHVQAGIEHEHSHWFGRKTTELSWIDLEIVKVKWDGQRVTFEATCRSMPYSGTMTKTRVRLGSGGISECHVAPTKLRAGNRLTAYQPLSFDLISRSLP